MKAPEQPKPKAPKPMSPLGAYLFEEAKRITEAYCKLHNIPFEKKKD